MNATKPTCPKGPALLAKAGVTFSEAQWLYRHQRGGVAANDAQLDSIRRKVHSFLVMSNAPARGCMAHA